MINLKKTKKSDFAITTMYLFAFLLPLNQKASTVVIFLWFAVSLYKVQVDKLVLDKKAVLLPLLYFVYIFSLIYTENFSFKYFEQKATLLVIPLIFYLNSYKFSSKNFKKTMFCFILGCLVSVLFCYFFAFYNSINFSNSSFNFETQIDINFNFIESSVKGGNYFYGTYFSIFHQTVYFAIYLCFSVLYLLFEKEVFSKKHLRNVLIIIFSIVIFQLASRAGIFTLISILLFYYFSKYKKIKVITMSAVFLIVFIPLLLLVTPRLKQVVVNVYENGFTFHREDNNSLALRLMTWESSIKVISENPVFGVGIGDAYNELRSKYKENRYVEPYKLKLNAHNQYFQIAIECGIIGVFVLLAQLLLVYNNKHKFFISKKVVHGFVIILAINFLFESVLNHYSGIAFYSFLYCLLFIKDSQECITN